MTVPLPKTLTITEMIVGLPPGGWNKKNWTFFTDQNDLIPPYFIFFYIMNLAEDDSNIMAE